MKKILVFGGSGFLGMNIVTRLSREDFVLLAPSSTECDLLNINSVKELVASFKPDIVINAAFIGVSQRGPFTTSYIDKNLQIVSNVLLACVGLSVEKIIQIGSSNEYGDSNIKINEEAQLEPKNLYGTAKAICSLAALELSREHNIPLVILRPFNVFGLHDDKSVIFYLIKSIINNEKIVLTKGEQIRDYLYSKDFAEIIFQLILNSEKLKNYEIYNIGSSKGAPLSELFKCIFKIMNKKFVFQVKSYNDVEYFSQIADTKKINKIINFPKITTLENGLSETVGWVEEKLLTP